IPTMLPRGGRAPEATRQSPGCKRRPAAAKSTVVDEYLERHRQSLIKDARCPDRDRVINPGSSSGDGQRFLPNALALDAPGHLIVLAPACNLLFNRLAFDQLQPVRERLQFYALPRLGILDVSSQSEFAVHQEATAGRQSQL